MSEQSSLRLVLGDPDAIDPWGLPTMPNALPPEKIRYAIETGFWPLRCVVELYDDGTQLRFRLFDPSDGPLLRTLLKMEGQRVSHLSDPQNLDDLISLCREHAEELGYRLDPRGRRSTKRSAK